VCDDGSSEVINLVAVVLCRMEAQVKSILLLSVQIFFSSVFTVQNVNTWSHKKSGTLFRLWILLVPIAIGRTND
jgi:hypothetical protein